MDIRENTDNENQRHFPAHELIQIQQIHELEDEELEEEAVDANRYPSSDDDSGSNGRGDGGAGRHGGFTFDTSLASLHTYLGEVDDIRLSKSIPDGGAVLSLPMFYLEGVVLFPEATLPLRVVQPRFRAAVLRAMKQEEAPNTIGVVNVRAHPEDGIHCSLVGTTAEIRQFRHLDDDSMNVVTRGQQRFHLLHCWIEADGAPCAQVRIIEETSPLCIPKDAFGLLASIPNFQSGKVPRSKPSSSLEQRVTGSDREEDETDNDTSYTSADEEISSSSHRTNMHGDASPGMRDEESSDSDEYILTWRRQRPLGVVRDALRLSGSAYEQLASWPLPRIDPHASRHGKATPSMVKKLSSNEEGWGNASKAWRHDYSKWKHRAQHSAWPYWVYRMFDAYDLARRVADMWRQMFEKPSMDDFLNKPELLSFHIASKIPVNDSAKQELLDISNVVYRLRREIQLLESIDHIRCKGCMSIIARRRDILVMSTDGPVGAYVNPHGFVHETLTLYKTKGLVLRGRPETEHSWFPGYAWTIVACAVCESHMGWLFTAVREGLHPKSFWGVRRSQLTASS
eukprot:TRINITY_DN40278_c0_g1_i1.p1 TRINITY_DN40278_c0_g1~~TRINITY_DN40278_c0_g1_i1.p1  ORF type:complete len:568 (-),score=122.60 TRINITY_DN40278_c0_g1_i1:122-1825(-)